MNERKLVPGDVAPGHFTGNAVAVRGTIAVAGAYLADTGATDSGAAYVFEQVAGSWTQTARLVAAQPGFTAWFGSAVAIGGDGTIVVGAEGEASARGAAYVFERINGAWTLTTRLQAGNGVAGDHFGFSVAIHGDTILVGGWGRNGLRGTASVFERQNGTWLETAELVPADVADADHFGYTVSVEGDTAIIGSPADDDGALNAGSAYVYTRTGGAWSQTAKLLASDGAASDFMARTGAISNGTVVLGARDDDDFGASAGSAYVFEQVDGAWTQTAKLRASDGRSGDIFGHAVAIDGDRIVVGAKWRDDAGAQSGAAYLFQRESGLWRMARRLNASDARGGDEFGQAVAVSGRRVLVGALRNLSGRGAAYLYEEASPVDAAQSTVVADVATLSAYGGTAQVHVTPRRADGTLVGGGLPVTVVAVGGTLVGPVQDNGDGTYTQLVQGTVGPAAIVASATADGVALTQTATIALLVISADVSTVAVDPVEVDAGSSATVTVTPKTADGTLVGRGLSVTLQASLGQLAGAVVDNGDGTYSQRIDTTEAGTASISATVEGVDLVATASLVIRPVILGDVVGFRADSTYEVYRSIQHALRKATRDQLVRIVVAPGEHRESVHVKDLTGLRLEALPSAGLTTIRGLRVSDCEGVTVDGFAIDSGRCKSAGIRIHKSTGVTIRNCIVRDAPQYGIRLSSHCADVLIDQCLVEGARRDGIRVDDHDIDARILRTTIRRAGWTGIHLRDRVKVRIEGCTITESGVAAHHHSKYGHGYGIFAQRTKHGAPEMITLIHNTLSANQGRMVKGRSDENFGNYDQMIDPSDDQEPFNQR